MLICLLFSPMPIRKPAHACTHTLAHTERVTRSSHFSVIQQAKNKWGEERKRGRAHESSLILTGRVYDSDAYAMSKCKRAAWERIVWVCALACVLVIVLYTLYVVFMGLFLCSVDCKFYARFPCVEWVAIGMCERDLSFSSEGNTYTESSDELWVQCITMNTKIYVDKWDERKRRIKKEHIEMQIKSLKNMDTYKKVV